VVRGRPLHPEPFAPPAPRWSSPPDPATRLKGPYPGPVPPQPPQPPGTVGSAQVLGEVPQAQVDYQVAGEIKRQVTKKMHEWRKSHAGEVSAASMEQRSRKWINDAVALWSDGAAALRGTSPTAAEDAALAQAVFDMLHRAGRLQPYLDRDDVEDILINGHSDVWLDLGDKRLVKVPPVADSEEELLELLRDLARNTEAGQSERTISTARPFLALRLADGSRLQAITAVSGDRTYVTIRRHGVRDADLRDMVRLGTISESLRAFLEACVKAQKNVMIVGPQRAGKTSLMRAMLRCLDRDERFATIETEFELWAHANSYFRQVVPLEAREPNGERGPDGRAVGEITMLDLMYRALRMSLSRIVIGEVRGPEITAMLQGMSNGQGGNLCTLHANSPQMVFDRIAELYLEAANNRSEQLAYRQAANGLDIIVYISMTDETKIGGRRHRYVSHVLEVTGMGENGRPATNTIFEPAPELDEVRAVPRRHPACINDLRRVGFPSHLLDQSVDTWNGPLKLMVGSA
jgi:pilus assembly protein CpaF